MTCRSCEYSIALDLKSSEVNINSQLLQVILVFASNVTEVN